MCWLIVCTCKNIIHDVIGQIQSQNIVTIRLNNFMNHLDTVLVNGKFFLKNKKILGLLKNFFVEMEFNSISFYKKFAFVQKRLFELEFQCR